MQSASEPAPGLFGTTSQRPGVSWIKALLPSLLPADQRVARQILANPEAVVRLSVSELARSAGTSSSTVVRFCQRAGYKGFHELKLILAQEVGAGVQSSGDVEPGDGERDVLEKVLRNDAETILATLTVVDTEAFAQAVRLLDAAERVLFVGVGTSSPLVQDATYRFRTIGKVVDGPLDAHEQQVAAALLRPNSVCFAVSHSGSTRETVGAVTSAKEAGATTIALTSFARSPLTEVVDIVLLATGRETTYRIEAMASRLAHLSLLDALFVAVSMRDPKRSEKYLAVSLGALSDHRF